MSADIGRQMGVRSARTGGASLSLARRPEFITVPLVFVVLIAAWQGAVSFFNIDEFILPGPLPVAEELWSGLASGAFLPMPSSRPRRC
jgi:ABC-type nitrate/sulfonate/bicarbonate transport system permease component